MLAAIIVQAPKCREAFVTFVSIKIPLHTSAPVEGNCGQRPKDRSKKPVEVREERVHKWRMFEGISEGPRHSTMQKLIVYTKPRQWCEKFAMPQGT